MRRIVVSVRNLALIIAISLPAAGELRSVPHWSDLPFAITDTTPGAGWHFSFVISNTPAILTMMDGSKIKGRLQALLNNQFLIQVERGSATARYPPGQQSILTNEVPELEIVAPRRFSLKQYFRDAIEPAGIVFGGGNGEIDAHSAVVLSPSLLALTVGELAAAPIVLPVNYLHHHEKWRFTAIFP